MSAEVGRQLATWLELGGAAALVLGLATRLVSLLLMVPTVAAIASVHWPEQWNPLAELLRGYRIPGESGDGLGNYKLPLLYLVRFLPLVCGGAGRWSLDCWLAVRLAGRGRDCG